MMTLPSFLSRTQTTDISGDGDGAKGKGKKERVEEEHFGKRSKSYAKELGL